MISLLNAVVVPPLIALIVSGSLVALLMRGRAASLALDLPNRRSLHSTPTPRLGGVGIVAGIAAALAYANPPLEPLLLAALTLLIGVSLLDDLKDVGVTWRLLIHVTSAGLAAFAVLQGADWWVLTLAALAIAWMINLYNFMDGSDGLAGGMATTGFGFYGIAAALDGAPAFATLCFTVSAAAAGFLCLNFAPARIFLGDVGAVPLGFLAAAIGALGWADQHWSWWFPPLVFSPFIVDATLTLARRALRGERVWQAHFDHYYQRLIRMGWSHRATALMEYALMIVCGSAGLLALGAPAALQAAVLSTAALVYIVLAFRIDRAWLRVQAIANR